MLDLPALTVSVSVFQWFCMYVHEYDEGKNLNVFKLCSVELWEFCTGGQRGIKEMFSLSFHLNVVWLPKQV